MADEWYRTPDWTPRSRDDFEARLRRARRYNVPQYLKIKALVLAEAGEVEGAEQLFRRSLDEAESWVDSAHTHTCFANLYRSTGRPHEAEAQYRQAIAVYRSESPHGDIGDDCDLSLAELIIETEQKAKYEEAAEILLADDIQERLLFNDLLYRYAVALARLLHRLGNAEAAAEWATRAVQIASIGQPQFSRHPTVGLPNPRDPALAEMWELARA